jgi:Protein of unknown function (DUF974)
MTLSFSLARALPRQQHPGNSSGAGASHLDIAALPPGSVLWLGETCVFVLTLRNDGPSQVFDVALRVEASVQGGSGSTVLHDGAGTSLPGLLPGTAHELRISSEVREQGTVSLTASATYGDAAGERKYHVQFFSLSVASPLSVRTRVRRLPNVQPPPGAGWYCESSHQQQQQQQDETHSSRLLLEVSVDNAAPLPLELHAVVLLPQAGVHITPVLALGTAGTQQHAPETVGVDEAAETLTPASTGTSKQLAATGVDSGDTALLHDSIGCKHLPPSALCLEEQSQQSQQSQQQPQQQQQQHEEVRVVQPGCGRTFLWKLHQPMCRSPRSASGHLGRLELTWSSPGEGRNGKLLTQPLSGPPPLGSARELHLQLKHLLPATNAHQQQEQQSLLRQQSTHDPAQHASFAAALQVGQPAVITLTLSAAPEPTTSSDGGTISDAEREPSSAGGISRTGRTLGPLVVLCSEVTPPMPTQLSAATATAAGGRVSSSGGSAVAPAQSGAPPAGPLTMGMAERGGSAINGDRSSAVAGLKCASTGTPPLDACMKKVPDVVVQGPRSVRVEELRPGDSVDLSFALLPVRRGWVRLPAFAVVSEADGRLLDSVHDVQVLSA